MIFNGVLRVFPFRNGWTTAGKPTGNDGGWPGCGAAVEHAAADASVGRSAAAANAKPAKYDGRPATVSAASATTAVLVRTRWDVVR